MKNFFKLTLFTFLLIIMSAGILNAAIVDELNYINEKSDFYSYINFSQIMNFIAGKGIDINDIDSMVADGSDKETGRIIREFGIKLSDVNEFLMVINTQDLEKKSGYLIFISFKNGRGFVPDSFKKSVVKLKSGTAYKASAEDDVIFTKVDDFFVIGSTEYIEVFLEKRNAKKISLSPKSSTFIKKITAKSMFFQITVSEYLKNAMNNAMNAGTVMARGLRENVFIQTILSLDSMEWGMEMNNKIIFLSGLQGSKVEDSERLQMLCHTWIVGSSFIVSFADLMAARSGDEKLSEFTNDQKLMSWLQQVFGRIHVKQEDKGVTVSFEMTSSETDIMISFIKKEMEKEKKLRAERIEREKISKLTLAINENDPEKVLKYINEKYNINGLDTDGNTPLSVAVQHDNLKIARLLLEKGAGINVQNIDKLTPLHQAVKNDRKDMVAFLLGKGCEVNGKGDMEMTALHYNAMQGNSEITRILIAKGASINAVDADASTPLHYAAASGFIQIVKVLVEKKADPNLVNKNEQRAIDAAAQNNQADVVEYLKATFKQEPKNYSMENYNPGDDFKMNDDLGPKDEGAGDPVFEE